MTKKDFTISLKALQTQYDYDLEYADKLAKLFKTEDVSVYDNEELYDGFVHLLASNFKDKTEAKFQINEFMYDFNFGRTEGARLKSSEDLWNSLLDVLNIRIHYSFQN
jgi:hypothetical protein